MKLARFSIGSQPGIGLVVDGGIVNLAPRLSTPCNDLISLMSQFANINDELKAIETHAKPDFRLTDVTLLAPIARPGKIMGIGLNYSDHAKEANMELPADQLWFSKANTCANDPFGDIQLPKVSDALDYEAELVFVIGKRCRHVSRDEAAGVIFGYCVGNDVTVRDWQFKTSQFVLGKSFDTHAPFGPWIVTGDAIDPHNLPIRCKVNGEERQSSNTKYFIFDCYAMVEHLSKVMTLEPGDIVFTGTPSGVGAVRKPPLWLRAGDVVTTEIEGIGFIENRVIRE